jgi:hypothetical protein
MSSGGDSLFSATLVTTDVLEHCGRDLTANELRLRIQVMVGNKGFRVTRVLDVVSRAEDCEMTSYTARTIPGYHDDRNLDSGRVTAEKARICLTSKSGARQAAIKEY